MQRDYMDIYGLDDQKANAQFDRVRENDKQLSTVTVTALCSISIAV